MEEMVSITRKQYDCWQDREDKLSALEEMGVDNWSGYDDAMQLYREYQQENK